eukprot:2522996-Amphidinium_carterae.1
MQSNNPRTQPLDETVDEWLHKLRSICCANSSLVQIKLEAKMFQLWCQEANLMHQTESSLPMRKRTSF